MGEWQDMSNPEDQDNPNYLYFNGQSDSEYASNIKKILDVSFTSENSGNDEESFEKDQLDQSESVC